MFRYHSERAITILNNLVPTYHLLLASAQRVKALILEEIALDYVNNQSEPSSRMYNNNTCWICYMYKCVDYFRV